MPLPMLVTVLSLALVVRITCTAIPSSFVSQTGNFTRPLVIWHGLGDSHSSPGMLKFMSLTQELHPGLFVHSVFVAEDLAADQKAGYFGNVDEQVNAVAEQLASIPELTRGFDAVGFSQGGQFLRAFVERYNNPPVHNLITFGSQHMGVSDIPACKPFDLLCQLARGAVSVGVYSEWSQNNVVPAQYYRDPFQFDTYLASNRFLTSINNEVPNSRNQTYANNFRALSNLVLVLFNQDKTVVPKESAWFGSYASSEGDTLGPLIPMKQQPLYMEDWIGLKSLDQAGRVKFIACDGHHMQLSPDCWEPILKQYVGGSLNGDYNITRYHLVAQG